jgi:hypothetical protein
MTSTATPPQTLAAALVARVLHDISGPSSGVAAGLDLLAGPGGAKDDSGAFDLAASSAQALLDLLEFHKLAFGSGGEPISGASLERLAQTPFAARRPRLEWRAELDPWPALAAQATLVLVQITAGGLAAGGLARATASRVRGDILVRIDAEGPRAALPPEALEGLQGRDLSRGLPGRWAPSRYLHALVTGAGGDVRASAEDGHFSLSATLPPSGTELPS